MSFGSQRTIGQPFAQTLLDSKIVELSHKLRWSNLVLFNCLDYAFDTFGGKSPPRKVFVGSQRTIEIIRDHELLTNATNMGIYLAKLLNELHDNHPEVSNVRGRGVWAAFDLPSTEERDRMVWSCFEEACVAGVVVTLPPSMP